MGKMVIRYKIFPDDIGVDLQSVYNEIKQKMEGKAEVGQFKSEPIAFGLNAIILDIRMDDKANVDAIESVIKGIKNVGELEAIASTKI
jgi:elongation factor 1-beta